jgi:hypothetical protein
MEVAFRLKVIDELTTAAQEAPVLQSLQASSDRSGVSHLGHAATWRRRLGGGAS